MFSRDLLASEQCKEYSLHPKPQKSGFRLGFAPRLMTQPTEQAILTLYKKARNVHIGEFLDSIEVT
jgi:hypothetical protein